MSNRIPDMLNRPWAITAEKFTTMLDIYERHSAGEKFDVAGLRAAAVDQEEAETEGGYFIENGVAIVPIEGVLSKRVNLFSYFSGGTSTQILADTINAAAADTTAHSILLSIDSPGGEVDGTQVAAQAVAAAAKLKPVVAWLDGTCCSGAMWIASQANTRYLADSTTVVGSIGVVATHTDRSKADEMAGRKVTEVTAGKYKRISSSHAPLSQDGRDDLQGQVDQIYSVFVDDVAQGMGVDATTVLSDMADGKVLIGQQAIDAGLADGIESQDQLITQLAQQYQQKLLNPGAKVIGASTPGDKRMPFKSFETEADYQAAVSAEFERGKAAATVTAAQVDAARAEGHVAGATAERDRIKAVEESGLAGHEAIVNAAKYDGKSTGADVAVQIVAAEKKLRGDRGKDLREDAPAAVPSSSGTQQADRNAAKGAKTESTSKVTPVAIEAHIAKAKSQGRDIGPAVAAMELVEAQ